MSSTTKPDEVKGILAFFTAGLEGGAIKPEQISLWVDGIVAKDDEVDPFFAELALAGKDINKQLTVLKEYLGSGLQPFGHRVFLGELFWRVVHKEITPQSALQRLDRILYGTWTDPMDHERTRLYGTEADLDLSVDGMYGSVKEAMERLQDDLRIYAGFVIDAPEAWADANVAVEHALGLERERTKAEVTTEIKRQASVLVRKPWWKF